MQNRVPEAGQFDVRRLTETMAAEVVGLDLRQRLDAATRDAVYKAFVDNQILVFRDQDLTKEEQIAFTEQFGTLERHALSNRGTSDSPFVHIVTNMDAEGNLTGKLGSTRWHSDKSFRPAPSMATILHARILPPNGGDTVFANMHAAYEALDEAEKAELDEAKVVHSWELSRENIDRKLSQAEIDDAPPQTHPLARVHPDSGRRALFMGMHASHIEGGSIEAGRARIEALEEHSTQERFLYRHNWRKGDVLMWDNRCLLHRADPNFEVATHPRMMHRTCLRGTPTR
ncbi:MAG: TauD/TfdA family dioxygenase [Alphaproteobacteria bacterium]|jgi:taurine dioxygenase|nr:TauD/TfdA family dioxygenase [Alphaproteobacteria bacterium]